MTTIVKPLNLRPITGKRRPDPLDHEALLRAEQAEVHLQQIWVEHPPQRMILSEISKYLRVCKQRRGQPLTGRRLSERSQAGKSSTIDRLRFELAQEDIAAGLNPNQFRLLHITMDRRMTLKMLFQEILNRMGDEFPGEASPDGRAKTLRRWSVRDNIKLLEQRIAEWVPRLGVEAIVVDEIQLLHRASDDAYEVTNKLQAFLDRSVVPLIFVGDETSHTFFDSNPQFAARLMRPLDLQPLSSSRQTDRRMFKNFCLNFDRQIVDAGIMAMPSGLANPEVLEGLIAVSGGHVGRVARLIQIALPAAIQRRAATIELFDLSNAVREYAIPIGWINQDPFTQGA